MALVFSLIFDSIKSSFISLESSFISTKTGFPFPNKIAIPVEINVKGVVIISDVGTKSSDKIVAINALVPEFTTITSSTSK